jgi:hypothetical protein
VCRHNDEIEFVRLGELNDPLGCIARQQDSRGLRKWKLGLEERIKSLPTNVLLLFGNLGKWPYIELGRVTVRIDAMRRRRKALIGNTVTESMVGGVSFHR